MFQSLIKSIVVTLSFTALASTASAAFFNVTPSIGYKNHVIKFTDNLGFSGTVKMNQPVFGLGVGVQTFGGAGVDLVGSYSTGTGTTELLGVETESDYTHITGALQFSVRASLFKIHLGYLLYDELAMKNSSPASSGKMKGPGYQVGLGFNITPSITLLAQYEIHQFNEVNFDSIGEYQDIKNFYEKVDSQSTSLHLSMSF